MPLIDKTYFVGELDIPNTNNSNVETRLAYFIEEKQPDFLQLLLGELLYADYVAATVVAEGVEVDPIWSGLITADIKKAFAAYVYYYWARMNWTKTTAQGEVKPKAENSDVVYDSAKMVYAWNKIWPQVSRFITLMDGQRTTYPNWPYSYQFFLYQAFRPINGMNL